MPIPYNQLPIGEGLTPTGSPGACFFIDRIVLETIENDGPEWKYDDARFIYEAVLSPDAIFEGLGRFGEHESLCYSVRITTDPLDEFSQTPPRFGEVFLAFVRVGIGGYVVFEWDWRQEDPEMPGYPPRLG